MSERGAQVPLEDDALSSLSKGIARDSETILSESNNGLGDHDPKLAMYGAEHLDGARRVYLVEGTKGVEALRSVGLVAVTGADDAERPEQTNWTPLRDRQVVVLCDKDNAWSEFIIGVVEALRSLDKPPDLKIVEFPGVPRGSELASFLQDQSSKDPESTFARVEAIADQAGEDDRSDPDTARNLMDLAAWVRGNLWKRGDSYAIRWWRAEMWEWNRRRYRVVPDAEIRARILNWLDGRVPKPSPGLAASVFQCLQAGVLIPSEHEQPLWLSDEGAASHRNLIGMTNGLVDLDMLLSDAVTPLRTNTPRWFSPVAVDYAFNRTADCPLWRKFLDRCLEGDEARIGLLQEWFGYCLTNDGSQQKALFFEGEGANGKTVATQVLEQVVGSANCSHVPLELFGERFQLTSTLGKLVNICGDTGELNKVAEGFIKQSTGGDTMHFDRKFLPTITARPTARLVIAMNNRPRFSDRSDGIWRRTILVPWRIRIPDAEQDRRLAQPDRTDWPFRPELPGIFNWAIEGLRRLRHRGESAIPELCRAALDEYRMENDPEKAFLLERCRAEHGARIPTQALYDAYTNWCGQRGLKPESESKFGKSVRRTFKQVVRLRETTGDRRYYYDELTMS